MSLQRDERGATAILVSMMAVVLVGISAFVADFGLAFAHKRAAQTGADAAALGAAGVFATQQFYECADMLSNGRTQAEQAGRDLATANGTTFDSADLTYTKMSCESGDLVVATSVTASSPKLFGGIFGRTTDYEVERTATAVVEAGVTGPRLRPMALCASDVASVTAPGDVFRLAMPGDGGDDPESCPMDASLAGNWWTLDCPLEWEDDGDENTNGNQNGTQSLALQIQDGCSQPISVVPGQGSLSGMALNNVLSLACPTVSGAAPFTCLGGDPGQPNAGQVDDAWKAVINAGKSVPIPIFCSKSPGKCAQDSVVGTGTNAIFPVHKLMAVQVCGYHFGQQGNRRYSAPTATGHCATPSALSALSAMNTDNTKDVYLVLAAANLQISNVTADSWCKLGDECDGGLRQVRLVE